MGVPFLKVGYGARLAGPWRAVRVADKYLCGICRKKFATEVEAWSCVDTCFEKMLAFEPVIIGRRNLKQKFFCRFCAREFMTSNAAEKCAGECITALRAKYQKEREIVFGDPEKIALGASRPDHRVAKVSSDATYADSRGYTKQEQFGQKHDGIAAAESNAQITSSKSTRKTPRDVPDDEKFFRDAAKYACKECSARFFTRLEVIRCYDGHE